MFAGALSGGYLPRRASSRRAASLAAVGIVAAAGTTAAAQVAIDPFGQPTVAWQSPSVLVCAGDWRFPLTEVRQEIGPARFARQRDLQRDLVLSGAAFGYCEAAEANAWADRFADVAGPCGALNKLAEKIDWIAGNLFRPDDPEMAKCLTQTVRSGGECEGVRGQLTNLRTYDQIIVDRAELVLAYEVCASPERGSNSTLRHACETLESAVLGELGPDGGAPGMFSLAAPLPVNVALPLAVVGELTDGRYLSVTPENFVGVRRTACRFPDDEASGGMRNAKILPRDRYVAKQGTLYTQKHGAVMWGMCNELALADVNAASCRAADVYIDERGELHLNAPLTTRAQRRDATLCVDVSDFHPDQPLMMTVGLDATGSVPERVWPGETMHIGHLIDRPIAREDVLHLHVYGKAHGVSLAEVLRINGIVDPTMFRDDACRMARSWVPVVDHEVPIGDPRRQAVIPVDFGRGRVGETQRIDDGDYVILWVSHIEPSGSVLVEYARGQSAGYHPPPLLGEPDLAAPGAPVDHDGDGIPDTRGGDVGPTGGGPGTSLAMRSTGVDQPLLPRRARYPGSRVLRLGTPEGNHQYPLKVCTRVGPAGVFGGGRACDGATVIIDEQLFVHGTYHFGIRLYFGYTSFPTAEYAARPRGGDSYEVVQTASMTVDYDLAVLLAAYPFGRDPRRFSYNVLSADYWKSAALVAGFGLRRLASPWEDFYGGVSLPVANGVSLTALAHIGMREIPVDIRAGDTFTATPGTIPDLDRVYAHEDAVVVGGSLGLSFDYDLFERAFTNIFSRFARTQAFTSTGTSGTRYAPPPPPPPVYGDSW
jgi:hypothetical protein